MKSATMKNYTACLLVPARKGSKRIKHKNHQEIGGMTLIEWAISLADDLTIDCVISTNDEKMSVYEVDAIILDRPDELATDEERWGFLDYHYAIGDLNYDLIAMHQCTTPFIMSDTVRRCLELSAFTEKCVSVVSHSLDRIDAVKNGGVYVIPSEMISGKEYLVPENWLFIACDRYESIDVDEPEDLERAREAFKEIRRNERALNG